ncbi:MAG: hypothetical protein R3F21_04335 [Myxococcota bacterium]
MSVPGNAAAAARPSRIGRFLRTILRALLFAFVFGFAIGTWIRCSAERSHPAPIQYLGARGAEARASAEGSLGPA